MRTILKYALWLLGGIALLAAIAAAYNTLAPLPTYEVDLSEVVINHQDLALLARGAKLVSMTCTVCHRNEDGTLKGQAALPGEGAFGELYIPNITNHPEAGIGRYTDAELVHILRTGVRPDGSLMVPIMPVLSKVSDEDLHAIIAYLRSDARPTKGQDQYWPKFKPNFLGKALMRMAFKPQAMPIEPIQAPPISDQVAHGEYLADQVLNCAKCHSASFQTNDDITPSNSVGYYGGGNSIETKDGEVVYSANLTPHSEHGLGQWTLEEFSESIRYGKSRDGIPLNNIMPPFPALTEEEVAAIWAFLQTVPVLDNDPKAAARLE